MDLVAGEGIVGDEWGEMDENELAVRRLASREESGRPLEVLELPVVADFGEDDEVEGSFGNLVRDVHQLEVDVGQIGAAVAGCSEGAV